MPDGRRVPAGRGPAGQPGRGRGPPGRGDGHELRQPGAVRPSTSSATTREPGAPRSTRCRRRSTTRSRGSSWRAMGVEIDSLTAGAGAYLVLLGRGHLAPACGLRTGASPAVSLTPESIVRLEPGAARCCSTRRLLPGERVERALRRLAGRWSTRSARWSVRGAPAIGVAAALRRRRWPPAAAASEFDARLRRGWRRPGRPRSTCAWAVERDAPRRPPAARDAGAGRRGWSGRPARAAPRRGRRAAGAIGEHGAALLAPGARVLTHCNAGALATGGYGTALGVVRAAHRRDPVAVGLGGRDAAAAAGRPADRLGARARTASRRTLLADSMAGLADGARAGSTRSSSAPTGSPPTATPPTRSAPTRCRVLARAHGVPFYVAAPTSTIDPALPTAADIPIEQRAAGRGRPARPCPGRRRLSTIRRST